MTNYSLSIYISICLFNQRIYPSIYQSIYLYICLSIYLSIYSGAASTWDRQTYQGTSAGSSRYWPSSKDRQIHTYFFFSLFYISLEPVLRLGVTTSKYHSMSRPGAHFWFLGVHFPFFSSYWKNSKVSWFLSIYIHTGGGGLIHFFPLFIFFCNVK